MHLRPKDLLKNSKGTSVIEFALLLPLLMLLFVGMVDLCTLLDSELRLIHLSREAANVFSRGAGFDETFAALTTASGSLQLDGPNGRAILTKISLVDGEPVVTAQRTIGELNRSSVVGMPSLRTPPSGLGISTRLTGCGL